MRRLVPLALLAAGCHAVVIVAEQDIDLSSGTASTTAANTTSASDTTSDPSDTAGDPTDDACSPPAPELCDDGFDPLRALGLGCPGGLPLSAVEVASVEPGALRTARQFANAAWNARAGQQLLALSTGVLPAPDFNGLITVMPGVANPGTANANPEGVDLPAPVDPAQLGAHWQTSATHDLVTLRFDVTTPAEVRGFALDLAFFSGEYPRRADRVPGDALVVWITSESFTGDLAALGDPVTLPGLSAAIAEGGLVGNAPPLTSTGFEGEEVEPCDFTWVSYPRCPRGGALAWGTLRGPVVAGERLAVVLALADQVDAQHDTVVLLDAWRWTCETCGDLSESTCGFTPGA